MGWAWASFSQRIGYANPTGPTASNSTGPGIEFFGDNWFRFAWINYVVTPKKKFIG